MSAKLLDERPLLVLPSLAEEIGLNEAIALQQLNWTLQRDNLEEIDGLKWLRADLQFWSKTFKFWSDSTIRRTFENLESAGHVQTRRARNAKLYTIPNPTRWTGQVESSTTVTLTAGNGQDDHSPCKREEGEKLQREEQLAATSAADDGEPQLFEAPPAAPVPTGVVLDAHVEQVWATYVQHFSERLRVKELTAPRRRTIVKALKAAGWTDSSEDAAASARAAAVELCQRAIVGLKSYRADHPDGSPDVNISVIFETGPHSKSNLTDQIQWWSEQAQSSVPGRNQEIRIPLDLAGVPSVTKGTIQSRRREVGQMFDHPDSPSAVERGEAAVDWLRTHIGHEPKIEDGEFRGWQLVADFSPAVPAPRNAEGGDQAPKTPGTF